MSRVAHGHVGFRYHETVGGRGHNLKAFAGFLGEVLLAHQHAVAAVNATAHASAQLVQLRQAEAFGVLDNHGCRVRHVPPTSITVVATKDSGFPGGEFLHLVVFLGRFHAPVHKATSMSGMRRTHRHSLFRGFRVRVCRFRR